MPNPNLANVDFKSVTSDLKATLFAQMTTLLEGAHDDVRVFVAEIAPAIADAVAVGDTALTAELEAQLRAVAELNNLRAIKAKWAVMSSIADTAIRLLSGGIAAGLSAFGGIR